LRRKPLSPLPESDGRRGKDIGTRKRSETQATESQRKLVKSAAAHEKKSEKVRVEKRGSEEFTWEAVDEEA